MFSNKSYDFGPFNKYQSLVDEILNCKDPEIQFRTDDYPKIAILILNHIRNKRYNNAKNLYRDYITERYISNYSKQECEFIIKSLCSIMPDKQERIEFLIKMSTYSNKVPQKFLIKEYDEGTQEHFDLFEDLNTNFDTYKYCLKYPQLKNPFLVLARGVDNDEHLCFNELFEIEDSDVLMKIYYNLRSEDVKIILLFKIREYVPEFEVKKEDQVVQNTNDALLCIILILLLIILIFK